jgi:hypothetical protein
MPEGEIAGGMLSKESPGSLVEMGIRNIILTLPSGLFRDSDTCSTQGHNEAIDVRPEFSGATSRLDERFPLGFQYLPLYGRDLGRR